MAEEVWGHKIGVDLTYGAVIIDYDQIGFQNGDLEIHNPKAVFYICDETNRLAEYQHMYSTEPDDDGNYYTTFEPLKWRPISFIRHTNESICYVIGAQTTLPKEFNNKNMKKMVTIFSDGSIGVD